VRVNTVAPGMVDSPWNTGREDRVAGAAKSSPLKRVATSEDIASVILDLAAGFALATGSVIVVDGGAGGL
jgi:NAD(P)-dependent dehydrogenase (short-subunit alcohol dehydrogenase family)